MSDMKLIMENWNKYLLDEAAELQTVGQLKKLIQIHRAKEAGKEAGKMAAEKAIEQIPFVSNVFSVWRGIKDTKEMLGKLYGAGDDFRTNTALDKLSIDDNVSKIVDDPIEIAFLNYLMKDYFAQADDNDPLPDLNVLLNQYLASNFKGYKVEK